MKTLTYGMVGGGPGSLIGDVHRKAIRLDRTAQLVAACFSRTDVKNRAMAEQLGLDPQRCYADYETMARAEASRPDGIDFVVVATPNVSHYVISKAFLEAGIHVACDKPLCFDVEEAEKLAALAKAKERLFLVTYTYMGYVCAKHIRAAIKAGQIGKIRTVMAEYPQAWLAHEGDWGGKQGKWRCDPKQSGPVNCLGDIGTHIENAVSWLTGLRIRRVLAKLDVVVPGRILDDNDFVLLEYEGGATGCYWSSQFALGHDNGLAVRIYGEKGSIFWRQEEAERIILTGEDGKRREIHRGDREIAPEAARYDRLPAGHPEGVIAAMANLYRSFAACIQAKRDGRFEAEMIDFPTVEDGAAGIRYIHACLRSNAGGNVWADMA